MRQVGIALVAALLASCATSGTRVDPATVATFERSRTTYAEVEAALGQPSLNSVLPDGSRVVSYAYSQVQTRPATFIPVVGLFAGGADVHSESVTFTFSPDGVLRGGTALQGQVSSGAR
jgi:hypothetical protein